MPKPVPVELEILASAAGVCVLLLGVTSLPEFSALFPKWIPRPWGKLCPSLSADGVDLVKRLLRYDPVERLGASQVRYESQWYYVSTVFSLQS